MKHEAGSQPLGNPRLEIYCVEVAAGMSEDDASHIAGLGWEMRREPGETVSPTRSRIQRQVGRRLDARIAVLDELERGVDPVEHREFLSRNRRARAELHWFKIVLDNSGVEPDIDEDGNVVPAAKKIKKETPSNRDTAGKWLPQEEQRP